MTTGTAKTPSKKKRKLFTELFIITAQFFLTICVIVGFICGLVSTVNARAVNQSPLHNVCIKHDGYLIAQRTFGPPNPDLNEKHIMVVCKVGSVPVTFQAFKRTEDSVDDGAWVVDVYHAGGYTHVPAGSFGENLDPQDWVTIPSE